MCPHTWHVSSIMVQRERRLYFSQLVGGPNMIFKVMSKVATTMGILLALLMTAVVLAHAATGKWLLLF